MVGNVLSPLTFFLDSFHFPFCYELIVGSESTGFMEIVSDFLVLEHKHFLKPEQEIRNYFLALNLLEEKVKKKEPFSKAMVLEKCRPLLKREHPFEDRNGRTARLMSGYILDFYGYGFGGIAAIIFYKYVWKKTNHNNCRVFDKINHKSSDKV